MGTARKMGRHRREQSFWRTWKRATARPKERPERSDPGPRPESDPQKMKQLLGHDPRGPKGRSKR